MNTALTIGSASFQQLSVLACWHQGLTLQCRAAKRSHKINSATSASALTVPNRVE